MKVCVITLCYNEEVILPFFIRHYERVADRMIFYDGGSTDRTREIIAACPIAELRELDTGGRIDDGANVRIKNTAYRDIDADWFIVVDSDELLSHPDLRGFLAKCDSLGVNVIRCEGWNMIGDAIPADGLLTERMPFGVRDDYTITFFDKVALFARGVDVRFEPGGHDWHISNGRMAPGRPVKLLHYKWLSLEHVERKVRTLRLSENNIQHGWGLVSPGVPGSVTWVDYYRQAHAQRTRVDLQTREPWNSRAGLYRAHAARLLRGAARRLRFARSRRAS
jgi:glycosyltransferase involved in cell wall biosynthesis